MPRRHDSSKARRHWYYTRQQLCALFDVSDTTITNWKRGGLSAIDNNRPDVFHGYEVFRFLSEARRGRMRDPKDGKLFCPSCCRYQPLAEGSIDLRPDELRLSHMSGRCTQCDTLIYAYVPSSRISDIYRVSANNARDSSANTSGPVSGLTGESGHIVSPETNSINKRWVFMYQHYLVENLGYGYETVDEHLRSLARASAFRKNKSFTLYLSDDAVAVKEALRCLLEDDAPALSLSTIHRILNHCKRFFEWLERQNGVDLPTDLAGFFQHNRRERRLASLAVKGTELTFAQAIAIFREMPASGAIETRDKAIVALLLMTGIRINALMSLRGKHVDARSWWINQLPPEVRTKHDKHIRSYCLGLGHGMRSALAEWAGWRDRMGFGDDDAFFLPEKFIKPNQIGLGYRPAQAMQSAEPWQSADRVRVIIKSVAERAGFSVLDIGAHDFRKAIHPYLSSNADMSERHKVALQLNLGHTPRETIHKHYSNMSEAEREDILDELCRMVSGRSDINLVVAYAKGWIPEDDPDHERAQQTHTKIIAEIEKMGFKQ